MIKTSTHHDLIRFLYDETSSREDREMQRYLLADENLLEEFMQMVILKTSLDDICITPSDEVVENILNYSKTYKQHF
jgi:thiaminase